MFLYSTRLSNQSDNTSQTTLRLSLLNNPPLAAYDGQIWPSRLIGFGIGVVVFGLMSHWLFKEPFTLKTLICLGLGSLIVLIQILWK